MPSGLDMPDVDHSIGWGPHSDRSSRCEASQIRLPGPQSKTLVRAFRHEAIVERRSPGNEHSRATLQSLRTYRADSHSKSQEPIHQSCKKGSLRMISKELIETGV